MRATLSPQYAGLSLSKALSVSQILGFLVMLRGCVCVCVC